MYIIVLVIIIEEQYGSILFDSRFIIICKKELLLWRFIVSTHRFELNDLSTKSIKKKLIISKHDVWMYNVGVDMYKSTYCV